LFWWISTEESARAIRAIEMIHSARGCHDFCGWGIDSAANIVSAMRAGAREFLDRASNRER